MSKTNYIVKYACHPDDAKNYDTNRLRDMFLEDGLFKKNQINLVYSMYERFTAGGVYPVDEDLKLEAIDPMKSDYFCSRREIGIINIGDEGNITVDGEKFTLKNKEAIYISKGSKDIILSSADKNSPAKYYLGSTPAHRKTKTTLVNKEKANILHLGSSDTCNERTIYQLIVPEVVESCQLVMGLTELHKGSVWNTMPCHTHQRRMEAYFYFELPEKQAICHLMGHPQETRHIFVHNEQLVLSPEWGIHSGAGTANYSFIWGMGGENIDYTDMDKIEPYQLK